jgi:hypothetical protein
MDRISEKIQETHHNNNGVLGGGGGGRPNLVYMLKMGITYPSQLGIEGLIHQLGYWEDTIFGERTCHFVYIILDF